MSVFPENLFRCVAFHMGLAQVWQLPDFHFKKRFGAKARAAGMGGSLENEGGTLLIQITLACTFTSGVKSGLFESFNQIFLILRLTHSIFTVN